MNWTGITSDHVKAAGHGAIVDRARSMATGSIDPVTQAITGATARVRRAVSTGNVLDADPTKIPASLESVTIRLVLWDLMERIGLPMSDDQKETRRDDISDLKRITDNRTRVETPDTPAANAECNRQGQTWFRSTCPAGKPEAPHQRTMSTLYYSAGGKLRIVDLAERALSLMDAESRAEAEQLIAELSTENADAETRGHGDTESLAAFTKRAAAAFEADMQPVCNAIVSALHANDIVALKGLRALLPHLLEQVNRDPSLSDLLAHQLGKSLLDGMNVDPRVSDSPIPRFISATRKAVAS